MPPQSAKHAPRRVDGNQEDVVKWLRKNGATVQHISDLGSGCPDLLVGYQGKNFLLELKDDTQPVRSRKLTPDEKKWHERWEGSVVVVENALEACKAVGVYDDEKDQCPPETRSCHPQKRPATGAVSSSPTGATAGS